MTPAYKSELRGKLRGLYELRAWINPQIAQLSEVLGECDDLLAAADFITADGASMSVEEVERIAATLRRVAMREGE